MILNGGGILPTSNYGKTAAVTTVAAADPDNNVITFNISAGADLALFQIVSDGALAFKAAPVLTIY